MTTFGGTPDYIDALTQDQRVIYNNANGALTANQVLASFYCGGLPHVFAVVSSIAAVTGTLLLQFQFGYDPAFGFWTVSYTYPIRADQQSFVDLVPCVGTYCKISVVGTPPAGTNWSFLLAADTKGDNGAHLSSGNQLMGSTTIAVAAGATVDAYSRSQVGGLADLWWRWTGVAYTLTLNGFDSSGNAYELMQYTNSTAPADRKKQIVLPRGPINAHIVSGDGAGQSMIMSLIKA